MAKAVKNKKRTRKPTGLTSQSRQIVERILEIPFRAPHDIKQPTAKPREVNTSELMAGAMESASRLRVRVQSLADALVGNPAGEQGGDPAPCGLNSKIEVVIGELREAHDIIGKLGSYLGIEV